MRKTALHAAEKRDGHGYLRGGGPGQGAASALRRRILTAVGIACSVSALWLCAAATASAFSAHGSVEQVYVTGLAPGAQMSLLGSNGETVATQTADSLGGLLFRNVAPGKHYRVRLTSTSEESGPITVHTQKPAPWNKSIYKQSIPSSGYGYLTTRDGTQLAIDVHPPAIASAKHKGAVPTLIEYAGYGYANPAGPESGIAAIANLMGFAVVDVNMRGTGCSGGAFNYFEPLQNLDAYDVIETVAHQPWVLHHKVGMLGVSYGGISQLFAAQLRPPALAAIAPLSVVDATATTLYPGGVLNTGFAVPWAEDRQFDAEPAGPTTGEHWAYEQIQKGDTTCAANQDLHEEATNLLEEVKENSTYNPSVADPLDPVTFVHNINVPTFMACQWEDEQTGGHCADLAEHFTGTERKWFTFTNGAHIDSLDPYTFNRLYDFLELFVAHKAPIENQGAPAIRGADRLSSGVRAPDRRRSHAAGGPDPGKADVHRSAGGLQGAARRFGCCSTTAREPRRTATRRAGNPYPGVRTVVLGVPDPRHDRPLLVPRAGRRAQRRTGGDRRGRHLHLRCERHAADGLHGRHGPGRAVGRRVPVGMELGAAPGRLRRVLRVGAAQQRHDRDRRAAPSTSG